MIQSWELRGTWISHIYKAFRFLTAVCNVFLLCLLFEICQRRRQWQTAKHQVRTETENVYECQEVQTYNGRSPGGGSKPHNNKTSFTCFNLSRLEMNESCNILKSFPSEEEHICVHDCALFFVYPALLLWTHLKRTGSATCVKADLQHRVLLLKNGCEAGFNNMCLKLRFLVPSCASMESDVMWLVLIDLH